jgi:DnaJ-domain-containing protein 1
MFQKRRTIDKEYLKNRRKAERQRLVAKTESETLGLLFSFVAGADGDFSDEEQAEFPSFMAECARYTTQDAESGGFNAVASARGDVLGQLRRYMSVCRPTLASRRRLLRALKRLAECDGVLNEQEASALDGVAGPLQLAVERESSRERNTRFSARRSGAADDERESASGARERSSQRSGHTPVDDLWCYAVLGCSQYDSEEVVKHAYRRLAALLHPDKYSARALSPEQIRVHEREFQRLQEAYVEVKRLRAAGDRRRRSS